MSMQRILLIASLLVSFSLQAQINIQTPFNPATASPIDVRLVIDNLSDTSNIAFPYEGMLVYVKSIDQYWYNRPPWTQWQAGGGFSGSWNDLTDVPAGFADNIDNEASSGGGVSDGDKGDVVVSNSGATWSVESLNANGKVRIQEDREPIIEINNPVTDLSGSGNAHGIQDLSEISRGGNMAYNSYDARVVFNGVGNTHDHYAAFQSITTYLNIDSVRHHYGLYDQPKINNARIGTRYGAHIPNVINQGGGSVTNNIGLYIGELTATNDVYAIYAERGRNFFQRNGNTDMEMAHYYRPTFGPNSIQYLRFGAFTNTGGRVGFRIPSSITTDFVVQNTTDGSNIVTTLESLSNGQLRLPFYGSANFTGTPVLFPAFDAQGYMIQRTGTELFDDIVLGTNNRIPVFDAGGGFRNDSELTATDDVMRVEKALRLTGNGNGVSIYSNNDGFATLGDFVGPSISMNNAWVYTLGVNMGVNTSGNNVVHTATLGSTDVSGIVINEGSKGSLEFYSGTGLSTTSGATVSTAYRRMEILNNGEVRIPGTGGNAVSVLGRDVNEALTNVTIGTGLNLSSGELSVDDVHGIGAISGDSGDNQTLSVSPSINPTGRTIVFSIEVVSGTLDIGESVGNLTNITASSFDIDLFDGLEAGESVNIHWYIR